jgi:hypothetical protein
MNTFAAAFDDFMKLHHLRLLHCFVVLNTYVYQQILLLYEFVLSHIVLLCEGDAGTRLF